MGELLAPWFATADRLGLRWRRCTSTESAHGVETRRVIRLLGSLSVEEYDAFGPPIPSRDDQRELREALELFALALRVDASAFVAAASLYPAASLSQEPPSEERLAIQLVLDTRTPAAGSALQFDSDTFGYKSFFQETDSSQRSHAFQCTHDAIVERAGFLRVRDSSPRFDLQLQVRLCDRVGELQSDLLAVLNVLTAIDRTVFRITRLNLEIESPVFSTNALELFFAQLCRLANEVAVQVSLVLPTVHEDRYTLDEWKTMLEYVTLQPSAVPSDQHVGKTLTYELSVVFGETTERLAIATLSALSRTSRISSLRIRDAAVGHARTQWLGHLIRSAVIPSLSVDERHLEPDQLSIMQEALPKEEIQRWTARKGGFAAQGQSQLEQPSVKTFSVAVHLPSHSLVCVHKLPHLVAGHLERISIEIGRQGIPWSSLTEILESCPQLQALKIKTLQLKPHDLTVAPTTSAHKSLKSLILETRVASISFIHAIRPTLQCYGSNLTELRLRCTWSGVPVTETESLGDMIRTCCPVVDTLEICGLEVKSLYDQLTSHSSSFGHLQTLVCRSLDSASPVLLTALANLKYPLARSLRTLHITDYRTLNVDFVRSFLNMLQTNNQLQLVRLVVPTLGADAGLVGELMAAHKAVSRNRRKLAAPNKLAFIDTLNRIGVRWDPELLAQVFAFAAPSERRRVVVAFREGE